MRDDYDFMIEVLKGGRVSELEELAVLCPGFPEGEDPFLGERWIGNAVAIGAIATIEWMLRKGVDLSFREDDGYTPLHTALERDADRYAVLELLLAAGAPVNARGINDWTAAHMAAARDDVEALRILVRHGADLTLRTTIDDYATPLEEARNLGRHRAVRFLQELG